MGIFQQSVSPLWRVWVQPDSWLIRKRGKIHSDEERNGSKFFNVMGSKNPSTAGHLRSQGRKYHWTWNISKDKKLWVKNVGIVYIDGCFHEKILQILQKSYGHVQTMIVHDSLSQIIIYYGSIKSAFSVRRRLKLLLKIESD